MQELADQVYDRLSEAIDQVEKDLEFNPKKFLGIALYPDQLWSWVTFAATIAFGLLQSKLTKK